MILRAPHQDAVLTSEEVAVIRRVLAACSQVLTWAGQHGSQEFQMLLADVTQAAEGRSTRTHCGAERAVTGDFGLLRSLLRGWRAT